MNVSKEVLIEDMSYGPFAVTHNAEGQVIFAENVCPGDVVDLEVYDARKDFSFANVTQIHTLSGLRNPDPRCKLHKICGSCQWQHIDYQSQLDFKKKNLADLVSKAKINFDINTMPNLIGMDNPWNYRNKVTYPVSTVKDTGRMLAGYFKRNSKELINIKFCPIQYSLFDEIIEKIKELCNYEDITDKNLRHIMVRSNHDQSEVLVCFIMRRKFFTDKMHTAVGKISRRIMRDFTQIKTCTINYNDNSTNVILGNETEVLIGEGFVNEVFKDVKLKISTESFFQVNIQQFGKIVDLITDAMDASDEEMKILDVYCGIGTISLAIAKKFSKVKILGIESVASAIKDAKQNAIDNGIEAEFVCSSVEEESDNIKAVKPSYMIINPPRKGCTNKVLDAIAEVDAKKFFYVSCNPSTLMRDIKYLEERGFKLESLQGVDMFPHTYHIETLAVLSS